MGLGTERAFKEFNTNIIDVLRHFKTIKSAKSIDFYVVKIIEEKGGDPTVPYGIFEEAESYVGFRPYFDSHSEIADLFSYSVLKTEDKPGPQTLFLNERPQGVAENEQDYEIDPLSLEERQSILSQVKQRLDGLVTYTTCDTEKIICEKLYSNDCMTQLKLSKDQVEILESKTNEAYNTLKSGLAEKLQKSLFTQACSQYGGIFNTLQKLDPQFMEKERNTEETNLLDRYFLQYAVGRQLSEFLANEAPDGGTLGDIPIKECEEKINELRQALRNKDTDYDRISRLTWQIAKAGRIDILVQVMDGIRETYEKPDL